MGSTAAQGWYLFLFLVGFTLGPAGLFALGWPVALVGFALLAGSFAGFRAIKSPEAPGVRSSEPTPAASMLSARPGKTH